MSWTLHDEYLPSAAFGACFKCRASKRPGERILDPNLVTDDLPPELVNGHHDGHIQICEACITEAAQMLGMSTPAQAASLDAQLRGLVERAREATARAEAAEAALKALRIFDDATASASSFHSSAPSGRTNAR